MPSSRIENVVIMAAGRGSRMRPLTDEIPKALAPYNETTLIGASIEKIKASGRKIHVTVGYKKNILADYLFKNFEVDSLINTTNKDNSWWIFNSLLKEIKGPVLVLTCDNITDLDFDFLEKEYSDLGFPACALIPVIPVAGVEGDYIEAENSFVTKISRSVPSDKYCSGIQILDLNITSKLCIDGSFNSLWDQLISKNALRHTSIYRNKWISIDTLEQLNTINEKNIGNFKAG